MEAHWKRRTALFLISQGITLFGSSVVQFAIVWYVTLQTGSGAWVSALTISSFAPQFLISFVSGVWADRYSRKAMILASDGGIALATLALIWLLPRLDGGTPTMLALLAASAVRSVGAGIQTPAVNAMLPQLAPQEHWMRVNGVNATLQSAVQFASPAAAAALLTFGSLTGALLVDILTAAAGMSLLAVLSAPKPALPEGPAQTGVFSDMKDGLRYAFRTPRVGQLLYTYGAFIFFTVPAGFLATLFVTREYGDSYSYMSLVEIIGFLGMAGGGALIGAWGGFPNRAKTLACGVAAFGALAVGMGAIRNFIAYLILMAVYGIALTAVQTAMTTLLQERAEESMQGRVFGLLGAAYSGCLPLGMAVFGPLSDIADMRLLMSLSGIALLLLAAFVRASKSIYAKSAV